MRRSLGILILGAGGIMAWFGFRKTNAGDVTAPAIDSFPVGEIDNRPATVRANNPGAILYNGNPNYWNGQDGYIEAADTLAFFTEPVMGARAMVRSMRTRQSREGVRTIFEIINGWSGGENSIGYANYVADKLGVTKETPWSVTSDTKAAQLAYHMSSWETGQYYFSYATFLEGARRA